MDQPRPDDSPPVSPPALGLRREVVLPSPHERGAAALATVGLAMMMLTTSAAMLMRGSHGRPPRVERRISIEVVAPTTRDASFDVQLDAQLREDCARIVQRASSDDDRGPIAERCLGLQRR